MPMLGDLLAMAQRSSGGFADWLKATHGELADRCRAAADAEGRTLEHWIAESTSQFERFASPDDWASLMSKLMASDDPGTVCLLAMTRMRLDHIDHAGPAHPAHRPTTEGEMR